jgi:hypothetical protein
MKDG